MRERERERKREMERKIKGKIEKERGTDKERVRWRNAAIVRE